MLFRPSEPKALASQENVSNGESETMRLGQGKPKGTLWGPSLGMKKTLVSSLL